MMPLHPPGRNIAETLAEDREAVILADFGWVLAKLMWVST